MAIWQSDKDICDMYRHAANPKEQIRILAQLNICTEKEIRDVLERNGIEPVGPRVVQHRSEPYKPWTIEEMVQLLYLVANGMTDKMLSEHFKRSETAIRNMKCKINRKRTENARAALEIFKCKSGGGTDDKKAVQSDTV